MIPGVLEECQLVIDRPRDGEPDALLYVAEPIGKDRSRPIATSPVFHPDLDPTAHRAALAHLESLLQA
jgi:hypothetical protein